MEKQYIEFIADLKKNIVQSRYIAARLANKEQLMLYLQTGKVLSEKIESENWGTNVLEQISKDLQEQLPDLRGFSHRNLLNIKRFYSENQELIFSQSPTAKFTAFWGISFTHHILLLKKCKMPEERNFYMEHAATNFWSVSLLEHHIEADLFKHQGKLPNNFDKTLPDLKPSALQVFRDEYLIDFISSTDMGTGFCFLGNQYRLEVADEEFFIDLLFFNRHLQCLVAFELKRGKFKPEYAGQLNFYLNVLDEKVKLPHENPSIGIVLCKEKTNTIVEFSIRNIAKAMGVATYRTTKEIPKEMKGILPDTAELVKLL
jgi:predicted nuclease of restriction endonuclease-like (RecB) superfamily